MEILAALCRILAVLVGICYCYQIVYLILPLIGKKKKTEPAAPRRYAILIAARNEERVIPYLLDSIAAQDYPADCLTTFVVADNCTDHTAEAARAHGARVYARFNRRQVGKGYALDYLLRRIDLEEGLEQYDAFLVFDADNLLRPDYIRRINSVCGAGYEAFCGYRSTKNFGDNWLSAGYGVWYLHDSAHLNQSRMMLGTCCAVSGTGFGFTRELLEKMGGWRFYTLTEDIEFDTWCATHGVTIGYCHDAIVYDEQPTDFRQSWRQRTRWTQGGIQIFQRCSGDLLRGLFQGGKASYSAFETMTLSMWGCLLAGSCGVLTAVLTLLTSGWQGLVAAGVLGLVNSYVSLALVGALTVASEWKRIPASARMKLLSVLAFPVFMLTFLPIGLTAMFRRFEWTPTRHTAAVSEQALSRQ